MTAALLDLPDLLSAAVDTYGGVTFRALPAGHRFADTGCVVPREGAVCLPAKGVHSVEVDGAFLYEALYRLVETAAVDEALDRMAVAG